MRSIDGEHVAFIRLGPEPLSFALLVIRDDRAGGFEDIFRRAVILLEAYRLRAREIPFEIENVPDIGAPPAVYRLVFIPDNAHIVMCLRQKTHQLILAAIRILVFVNHDVTQAPVPGFSRSLIMPEQPDTFEQQIVEIERICLQQGLFVLLEYGCYLRHPWIGRLAIHLLRSFSEILRMADLRESRTVWHSLFVETKPAISSLDDLKLVFIVVDRKCAREAGPYPRKPVAIAPQQPYAERVKSRNERCARKRGPVEERSDARPHFFGGFVGKCHRENCRRRHMHRADEMRNSMRDDPGLAAACAGKDQHRAFGTGYRFTLLGVETLEEIH
jgi:hypothetical protein